MPLALAAAQAQVVLEQQQQIMALGLLQQVQV
jgi:hypothetical protein